MSVHMNNGCINIMKPPQRSCAFGPDCSLAQAPLRAATATVPFLRNPEDTPPPQIEVRCDKIPQVQASSNPP